MPLLYKKKIRVGAVPGSIESDKSDQPTRIELIDYDAGDITEKPLSSIEESFSCRDTGSVSWINIIGNDADVIRKIDEHFGIHPLVLEDVVNLGQRPKIEEYEGYLFLVLKMIYFDKASDDIVAEQIGLVIGENYVISFQEREGDVFETVRERIRESRGRIRKMKADYLAYALLDAIVDHYFVVLERMGERIDALESELLDKADNNISLKIYRLKTQVIFLRKQIWPLREVLANFHRMESALIDPAIGVFLRDVYDHSIQVNDTLEAFRDAVSGLHDIYLSTISNRMNEVMKVLTIFSALFIPLTFIAGIYGMNFEYMPELKWRYSYFVAVGVMVSVGLGMIIFFKRKGWM